ncbi:hypothetical protein BX666DRAFT_1989835 [Dichotomocladium elegans]|nr:hypothetical protein BX666DRAFT_1989835 [Dichotomocladium elegans]
MISGDITDDSSPPPTSLDGEGRYPGDAANAHPRTSRAPSDPTTGSNNNTKRRITVQSINVEHKVWINVSPTETGLSLAKKIHNIATFQTRKIIAITTAAGRIIPLDHRPVFGSWMDMDNFKDGEEWKVEWCKLDKGFVDRFISRFIQVSGSSRQK